MRIAIQQRSQNRVISATLLALAMFTAIPGQVFAAAESCNPDLDFTILNDAPFFLGEEMRISANLGAKDIAGGSYQDISAFGFALNCHMGEDFHSCNDAGNKVEFLGNPTTDCKNAAGDPARLLVPQQNIIPIRVANGVIRTGANDQCNVQFDMKVTELAADGNGEVVQAMGWPIANEPATVCDNGLTSSATSTIMYEVETCGIEVIKEVSIDGQNWFDANTEQSAPRLGPDDMAYYRLKVKNTSSVDYIGDLLVSDPILIGDDPVSVTPAFDQNGEMIIGGVGSIFESGKTCAGLIESGEGFFTNTASVEGTCRGADHSGGKIFATESDIAKINCFLDDPRKAEIELEKHTNGVDADAEPGPYIRVGEQVTWTYKISNTGNEGITIDSLVDDMQGPVTCADTFLAKDESTTCTATGVAVPGQYANLATVDGTSDFTSTAVQDSDPSHYFGMLASIDLVKSAVQDDYEKAGDVINYNFLVTNTSNVVLTGVNVTDPLPDLSIISCPKTVLAVDESMTCTATYTIKQSDVDNDAVNNTATARGTAPNGDEVTDTDSETISTTPPPPPEPSLALVKTALPLTYSAAGDVITYSYLLTNDGTATLYPPYVVVDDKTSVTCPSIPTELVPGQSVTCGASYTILDGDITARSVTNVAYATAKDAEEGGLDVRSNDDQETVYYIAITVRKEIFDGEGWLDANTPEDALKKHYKSGAEYRVIVENTGEVDLENVMVNDPTLGVVNYLVGSLAVGATATITEAEVPELLVFEACTTEETVKNTATASGSAVTSGLPVNHSDDAYLVCVGRPEIDVTKWISIDGGQNWVDHVVGPVQIGSAALYKITVENVGQVDLKNVEVSDSLIPGGPYWVGDLAKTQVVTITDGEWPELDMDPACSNPGMRRNIATAVGTSVDWEGDTDTDTDDARLECIGPPMISIMKEVSLDGVNWYDANGEDADPPSPFPTAVYNEQVPVPAEYRLTVMNIGTVTLDGVLINDPNLGIVDYAPIGVGGAGVLAAGEMVVIDKGTLVALETDNVCIGTGEMANIAYVEGYSPAGVKDETSDPATVECIGAPAIRVLKEVSDNGINWQPVTLTTFAPSDAHYRITVTNVGNVALENVMINDSLLGIVDYMPIGADGAGMLGLDESVVIDEGVLEELYWPTICTGTDEIPNTVFVDGKATDSTVTVEDDDSVTLICQEQINICAVNGKPTNLKFVYTGTPESDHHQYIGGEPVAWANPDDAVLPDVATIELYDKENVNSASLVFTYHNVAIGDHVTILGDWGPGGLLLPNILFKILDGDGIVKQTIFLHGSCSAPLYVGDKHGAMTIIGYTP